MLLLALLSVLVGSAAPLDIKKLRGVEGSNTNEGEGLRFLRVYDGAAADLCHQFMAASWEYNTNITEYNRLRLVARQLQWSQFHRASFDHGKQFAWRGFSLASVRRMFSFITVLGRAALPPDSLSEYADLLQRMKSHYSSSRVCRYRSPGRTGGAFLQRLDVEVHSSGGDNASCLPTMNLEPELTRVMATSRDPRELRHAWRAWRDVAGAPLRPLYTRFATLANQAAQLNGFPDAGAYWRSEYESQDLEGDLDQLWEQLKHLYHQLHAFVRRKLRAHYGGHLVPARGPIPAHLLGNMWAQDWSAVQNLTLPYPARAPYDVTAAMNNQGYTPVRIFRLAENFYRSLGLDPVPLSFWRDSMFSRPRDREVVCHASAWDMCNGYDYRVKMCTDITMEDLIKAHHEMGHIQYDMLYRKQPFIFRDGANPGFHESVGDVIALSAATPRHMRALGLLPSEEEGEDQHRRESDLNHLFGVAMTKVAFLPFALVLDKWRWRVFSGAVPPTELNQQWWALRMNYSGVSPPVMRTETDFDPGAKYHVAANTPYVRYLVSFILQFQLHESLCQASGHEGPLHTCSIYGSRVAGERLRRGLSLGRSEPWPSVLAQVTAGQHNRLDAGPVLRYFAPLKEWLEEQNKDDELGWDPDEALVAGRLSAAVSSSTTAAYILLTLLLLALILITSCVLVRRWRQSPPKEETVTPASTIERR